MAKAKKRKSSKGKTNEKSSSGGLLVTIIILVIGGAVAYGMFFKGGIKVPEIVKSTAENSYSQEKSASNNEQSKSTNTNQQIVSLPEKEIRKTKKESLDGKVESIETNQDLPEYEEENPYYFTNSFDFAWPAYTNSDAIIEHSYFTLRYNEKTEQADWVAYKLTAQNLNNAKYKRTDNFKEDSKVNTQSAHPDDYKGSGFDRGHLAPAADFTWTKDGMNESFYMSNMSPQLPGFNRGIWKKLEEKTRQYARSNGAIYVVTGPIFTKKSDKIGRNKVAVPDKYYKAIIELQGTDVKGIAFVLNHEKSDKSLSTFVLSIDELEKITDLDFFPGLPDELENKIECCAKYSDW